MTIRVRRVDHFAMDTLGGPERMPNGWMRVSGRIARVGIQEYVGSDGTTTRELREPEQVFDDKAIASFRLVPLTNTHPPYLLDDKTTRMHAVGSVSEPRRDGDWLVADMLITDIGAVTAAQHGRGELSCGYECDLDDTPGEHPVYGHYDSRQTNITGNHLALVEEARAGHGARLRLDGSDACMLRSTSSSTSRETEPRMPEKIVIAGKRIELTDANVAEIQRAADAMQERVDSLIKGKRAAEVVALRFKKRDADKAPPPDDDDEFDEDASVECPQCGGNGKMVKAGDEDAMIGCDACDGTGKVPASSLGEFGGEIKDEDETDEADDELMNDADELEVEQETEKEAGAAHKDWKARRDARLIRRRKDARKRGKAAADKFVAAINRRIDHAVRSRVALEVKARQVLGAEADLAKLDATGVMTKVLEKLEPGVKFDAAEIPVAFKLACKRVDAGSLSGADAARAVGASATAAGGARRDGAPSRARVDEAQKRSEKYLADVPWDKRDARKKFDEYRAGK